MSRARRITRVLLRGLPLPRPGAEDDKGDRGVALVIGGSARVPGAVLLAGVAALRAGAGKLQIATAASASAALSIAVPEAMVVALPAGAGGEVNATRAIKELKLNIAHADAILLGPGTSAPRAAKTLLRGTLDALGEGATLVLDAAAVEALHSNPACLHPTGGRVVLTPHSGEMATLLGIDRDAVDDDPERCARAASDACRAVVVLKGPETWIASPDGALLVYDGGDVGLATSGSGDVLAGTVAGLVARGASPLAAAAWSVYAHGTAGQTLGRRIGRVGFLARELLDELPGLLNPE